MNTPNHLILNVADGTQMHAYTAFPEHPDHRAPGIILFQEAFGVNAHIRSVADQLVAAGYVVVAPELFHRTAAPGLEIPNSDFPSAAPPAQMLPHQVSLYVTRPLASGKACWRIQLHSPSLSTTGIIKKTASARHRPKPPQSIGNQLPGAGFT